MSYGTPFTVLCGTQRTRVRPCSSWNRSVWPPSFTSTRPFGARDFPRIAEAQPLVRLLHLPAVDDLLLEDAELVADAVADRRNLERRERIEETRGETAEAAVAEAGLVFAGEQLIEVQADLGDRRAHVVVHAEVHEVVAEVRPHQELGGEIRHRTRAVLRVRLRWC